MLGFSRRRTTPVDSGVGLLGKLPSQGDFLNLGVQAPAAEALRKWLERGVGWESEFSPRLLASLDGAPPRVFLYRPEEPQAADRLIIGLIAPSRDQVGRQFPIVVFGEVCLRDEIDQASVLPLAAGDFLERAYPLIVNSEHIADPRAALAGLLPGVAEGLGSAESEFDVWKENTPISTVASALFPLFGSDAWRGALWMIIEATRPFRGQENPSTPLGLKLPLGSAGVGGVVFWLSLVRRAMGWKRTVPRAFWHVHEGGGAVVICLGEPTPRLLVELWAANENDETLCDLTASGPPLGPLNERILAVLAADGSVRTLLEAL
jgi:type VI secretion system protein ImpM